MSQSNRLSALIDHLHLVVTDFPCFIEVVSARGDKWSLAILVLQPLWLTPNRYTGLKSSKSLLGISAVTVAAAVLWNGVMKLAFPEVSDLSNRAFAWDPLLGEMLAELSVHSTIVGLLVLIATVNWLATSAAAGFAKLRRAPAIQAPPIGYFVRLTAGQMAGVALLIGIGTMSRSPTVMSLAHGIGLTGVGLILAPLAAMVLGIWITIAPQIARQHDVQVFGSYGRAVRYQIVFIALGLTAAYSLVWVMPALR